MKHYGAPICRCGSRNTTRIGESALLRLCMNCGTTYTYRLKDGLLIPYVPTVALALDEQKAGKL